MEVAGSKPRAKFHGATVLADSRDREAWLRARESVLTASEVATVLGLSYDSRASLVRKKAGCPTAAELKRAEEDDVDDMAQVAAGRHLEDGIARWFAAETVHTSFEMCGLLLASPVYPRLAATPDAILDGEPVEIKLTGESAVPNWHEAQNTRGWEKMALPFPEPLDVRVRAPKENLRTTPGARDPRSEWRRSREHQLMVLLPGLGEPRAPMKYWVQLQVQMHVLGASQGWIVGAVGGTRRYDFLYAKDPAFERVVLMETMKFWSDVEEQRQEQAA